MKTIKDVSRIVLNHDLYDAVDNYEIKRIVVENMKQILKNNPEVDIEQIKVVGITESGKLQFKVPETFKNRQVIILLAYLKWFFDLNDEDLK